jgi:hypothetical protein
MNEWIKNDEFEKCGRKGLWFIKNTIPALTWRDQGKQRITTAKIVDILAQI